jgi:hypothetical protein
MKIELIPDVFLLETMHTRYRKEDFDKNFANWNPQPAGAENSALPELLNQAKVSNLKATSEGECDTSFRVSELLHHNTYSSF